ncbi:uncharacterized protein [Primulina eburnea]|uniref:uncharacterized protein n=1 Tax=Primulina eburnea TaxID=1245227 RepID=UPI003C6C8C8B
MRERRRYIGDTRVRHQSPPGPPPSHREYSPRRGRDGGKYLREDERRRMGRMDGFDRELDLQGGRFYDTLDRERYGAGPRRSRGPWRSDRDRNSQAGRISDTLYRDRYGIDPRHSKSPHRVEKRDSFDGDLNPRAGRFSGNVDRDRHGIDPRRLRSPQRIEKRDSFGVDPNPRAESFVDAVDKDRYGVRSRHLRSPRRIDGRDGFDGDSDIQTGRFLDAVGRDRYGAGSWHSRSLRRFGEKDVYEGDLSLHAGRFSDTLDRDMFMVGTRRSRTPGRIEKRDNFDLDMNMQGARFSGYDNRDRGKYGVDVESSRRLYEEDLLHGGSNSSKFESDHLSNAPRNSDGPNFKYSSYKNDNHGVGDDKITPIGGGERGDYLKNPYLEESQIGMSSVSHHLVTKPVFLEYDKGRRFYSDPDSLTHESVGGVTKSYLGAGDCNSHLSSVTSRYLNTDRHGYFNLKNERRLEKRDAEPRDEGDNCFETTDEGFNFKDGLYLDKLGIERPVGRDMYENKKEDSAVSLQGHLKGDSNYVVSSARSKVYIPMSSEILSEGFPCHSIAGDIPLLSHSLQARTGFVSDTYSFDGYNEIPKHMSPRKLGCRFDDTKSKSRLYVGLPEQKRKDNIYPKFCGSTKRRDFGEEYGVQHMSRFGLLNSVEETPCRNHMEDDRLGQKLASLGQSTSDNFVAYESLQPRNQDLDMLGSGSLHLNFEREKYRGRGRVRVGEYNDEVHDDSRYLPERSDFFTTKDDPLSGTVYGNQRNGMDLADLRLDELSQRRAGGKYPVEYILYERNTGIGISSDGSGARKISNSLDAGDDVDPASFLERPESSKCKLEKSEREAREIADNMFSSSRFITSRSGDPDTSVSRDIKKRLGPVRQRLHVSQRLLKKKKPSLRNQLAPAPSKKHATLPWLKSRNSKKVPSMRDESSGNHHNQGGEQMGVYFPLAVEPPEKSEDFKQLVHSAFFKFLKQINETPAKRKKYVEPGKDGSLKCIVCSSNSEEFVDTGSLAKHAFAYKKAGLRSQHLGFYKALCVLMGWKIAEEPSGDWHCEVLSNAETSALKEDLIIWPPVMIIHNCSIDKITNERVNLSTDTLDAKLRGRGIGSILKICNGKPANQNVMIVKFNGTLSALQEAERLHQHYVENKHGRSHLKQLKSSQNDSSNGDTQVALADEEEAFLYGYLGIAEDLDKLDSDTQKRCVVKSKKEILSIAKSSLDSNVGNGSFNS